MEQLAQATCLHLVAGFVHAATGIANHPQSRSKPCTERGDIDGWRCAGQHRAYYHVPGWAEMVRAKRRFNRPERIGRTVKRGFHPRTALSVGLLACLSARVGGLERALPPVLPASAAHAERPIPTPRRRGGWTCHFARPAAVGESWNRPRSESAWQLGRPGHLDGERDGTGRPCLHVLHGFVQG